jgi:hypothetical protein
VVAMGDYEMDSASASRVADQIGPHSAVTGWPKRVPFRDAPLARDGPLPLLTRRVAATAIPEVAS